MSHKVRTLTFGSGPYLSGAAVEFFAGLLTPDFVVFEFGSGGSTIWLAQQVEQLISVEHDLDWYMEVESKLDAFELKADVRLVEREPMAFVHQILEFPDGHFDLVFVDCWEKARYDSVYAARSKVKPAGWLVLDDSGWAKLRPTVGLLKDWTCTTIGGRKPARDDSNRMVTTKTSFFRKPFNEDRNR